MNVIHSCLFNHALLFLYFCTIKIGLRIPFVIGSSYSWLQGPFLTTRAEIGWSERNQEWGHCLDKAHLFPVLRPKRLWGWNQPQCEIRHHIMQTEGSKRIILIFGQNILVESSLNWSHHNRHCVFVNKHGHDLDNRAKEVPDDDKMSEGRCSASNYCTVWSICKAKTYGGDHLK